MKCLLFIRLRFTTITNCNLQICSDNRAYLLKARTEMRDDSAGSDKWSSETMQEVVAGFSVDTSRQKSLAIIKEKLKQDKNTEE